MAFTSIYLTPPCTIPLFYFPVDSFYGAEQLRKVVSETPPHSWWDLLEIRIAF